MSILEFPSSLYLVTVHNLSSAYSVSQMFPLHLSSPFVDDVVVLPHNDEVLQFPLLLHPCVILPYAEILVCVWKLIHSDHRFGFVSDVPPASAQHFRQDCF